MSNDQINLRSRRKAVRAARLRARRVEEAARSFFDGLIVLAATAVGLTVGHGAEWIASAGGALIIVLIGRAVAMWCLMPDFDQLLEAADAHEATLDALERDAREGAF